MEKNLPTKDDLVRLLTEWGYQRENIPFLINELQLEEGHDPFGTEVLLISLPLAESHTTNPSVRKKARRYVDKLWNYYSDSFDIQPLVLLGKWRPTA